MADGEKLYIADKLTVDKILALLLSSDLGLAALKGLIAESAGTAQETSANIDALGDALVAVKGYLEDNANGLGAIREAVDGRADAVTASAVKTLLEDSTYGLNALKTAITGRANETTATAVKALLENATYGLAALKAAITGNVKAIKSVQRGLAQITSGTVIYNITISSVDVSKTFVIAQAAMEAYNSTGIATGAVTTAFPAVLVNSTTLRLTCNSSTAAASTTYKMPWQVVEFY